jgi:hypothetical protein
VRAQRIVMPAIDVIERVCAEALTRATLIDETIDLHDRIMGTLFNRARRQHAERFQQAGKAINDKVRLYSHIGRALLEAK